MVKKKKQQNKQAYIHSRYRCPVLFRFSVLIFFRRSYDFKQSDSKKKKLIFTVGIVVLRQHVLFRFSVVIFSGGPMILNKAIVKIKSLYSQQVSLSNDNIIFFQIFTPYFFFRRSYIFFLGVCLLFNIFLLFDSNKLFD